MRVALLTPRAHFKMVEGQDGTFPGIMIEGYPITNKGEVLISNFFLPIIGCELLSINNYNGDDFSISSQVGLFKGKEGGLYLGPNSEHNDLVMCFAEFREVESVVLPKHNSPVLFKKLEFDEVRDDIYLMILVKDSPQVLFAFNTKDEVIEHEFFYNYLGGYVEHKCHKLPC